MKTLTAFIGPLLLVVSSVSHAQPQVTTQQNINPVVVVGSLSASITTGQVEFANLPSGKVIRIGKNGVEILDPSEVSGVDPSVPRVGVDASAGMPQADQAASASELEDAFSGAERAPKDGVLSQDDLNAIANFLLGLDFPFGDSFLTSVRGVAGVPNPPPAPPEGTGDDEPPPPPPVPEPYKPPVLLNQILSTGNDPVITGGRSS